MVPFSSEMNSIFQDFDLNLPMIISGLLYGSYHGYSAWSISTSRACKNIVWNVWCGTLFISVGLGTFRGQKQDSCNCDVRFVGHTHTRGCQVTIIHQTKIREFIQKWRSGFLILTSIVFFWFYFANYLSDIRYECVLSYFPKTRKNV